MMTSFNFESTPRCVFGGGGNRHVVGLCVNKFFFLFSGHCAAAVQALHLPRAPSTKFLDPTQNEGPPDPSSLEKQPSSYCFRFNSNWMCLVICFYLYFVVYVFWCVLAVPHRMTISPGATSSEGSAPGEPSGHVRRAARTADQMHGLCLADAQLPDVVILQSLGHQDDFCSKVCV